jgi:hypothetical protein
MRTSRLPIECDFIARTAPLSRLGIALLVLGALCAGATAYQYQALAARRAGLEMRIAALRPLQAPAAEPADTRQAPLLRQAAGDLATPWTLLLAELEQASHDSGDRVAVLGVEPDRAKHHVRVTAESRDLTQALAYVERLQSSRSIQYPMLDRHETRADDPQHPVRFELTGEWRDQP